MQGEARLHLDLAADKLQTAKELMANAHGRDAASRAYYAVFHASQALLRSRGLQAKTHRGLLHLLRDNFQGEGGLSTEEFQFIRRAMEIREEGDYDVTFNIEEGELQKLLSDATSFLARVTKILDLP